MDTLIAGASLIVGIGILYFAYINYKRQSQEEKEDN